MQMKKGSATVPVAVFGVSPNTFHRPVPLTGWCASEDVSARPRDADGNGRDDRAPHRQLNHHGSGQTSDEITAQHGRSPILFDVFHNHFRPLVMADERTHFGIVHCVGQIAH